MRLALAALALAAPLAATAGLPPRYGGELGVALSGPIQELDPARISSPAELEAARALFATLVEVGPGGELRPGLLASLPEVEPGARAFRLRLRPGLRFHDGRAVTAADVSASLARLVAPATRSSHGWIALPIVGAEEVRQGRATALSGVEVTGELELRIVLEVPFPDFPRALAALPAAVVARGGSAVGAGAFRLASRVGDGSLRLVPFDGYYRGRAYVDGLTLSPSDARRASRAFGRGELDLSLRPEAVPGAVARDLPQTGATYAIVNPKKLGPLAEELERALRGLDRSELARLAGRGHATPLASLLPPSVLASAAPPPAKAPERIGGNPRVVLLVATGTEGNQALADRLQVKLFDCGVRAAVETVAPAVLFGRLASGNYDVAIVSLFFTSSAPLPALLEAAWALGGPAAASTALQRLGSAEPAAAATAVAERLGAVPLFATGFHSSARTGLEGLDALADGTVDLGDLWLPPQPLPERPR